MTMTTIDTPTTPGALHVRRAIVPRLGGAIPLAAVALVAACLPFVAGPYYQQIGYQLLQFVALAAAWNLLAGYTGLASLGSGAFVGLGSYGAVLISNHWGLPLPVLLLAGGVIAALFAVAVSPALFRLRGLYFTVATLALAEALRIFMVNSKTFDGASGILLEASSPDFYVLYWIMLVIAVGTAVVVGVILRTPASLSLRGIRDDEDVAQEMGVSTFRTKLWVFALSGFLMGTVGALQAIRLGVVEPYSSFGVTWTVSILAVAILGGLGTQAGPWIGAVFTVVLAQLLRDYPEAQALVSGLVIVLVIRFAPQGIWGTIRHRGGRRGNRNR